MEEKDRAATENDAFSTALNGILSNPEMMSMISSMASKLKGESSPPAEEQPAPPPEEPRPVSDDNPPAALPAINELTGAVSALSPLLSGELFKGLGSDDDRACLLRALKPYLSKNRCEAIDHIITFSKLSHLFKNRS